MSNNNLFPNCYVFYGDENGFLHVVYLQLYKEIACFKVFNEAIFKIMLSTRMFYKLIILTQEGNVRIYKIKPHFQIILIKEIKINHSILPNKCICEEKINDLKESNKKENINEGISIFNLSYFLSSNYSKNKNVIKNDIKKSNQPNVNDNSYENEENLKKCLSDNEKSKKDHIPSNYINNDINEKKEKIKKNKRKEKQKEDIKLKNASSMDSIKKININENKNEKEINSDNSSQSVIIGGINLSNLGFNFTKFMNNKKKTIIIDGYLLTDCHLVTIANNGTIVLTKI